ncbi:uncharacterized protein RHOBADRAFT_46944 [Rhodotorula graminis WP1]|uniref:TM7S3/TM198-like domain-containing protein n=1 Tax=Rhodotorula graminis (strain WP1) TaxID=578459 RepID=A0A0P9EZ30_RHOGW|nr:uncharacterized protein RHOBADRAFT_46944 [Rhodotorula graminis WP1]KPV72490.1 hypothetical protein RHOBADRAFT_46944 [Rhodotorula graminis WP1]
MPPFLPLFEHSPPSSDFRRLPFLLLARAAGSKDAGFVTSRLSALPKGVLVVVGVWLILSALVLLGAGARALFVGRDWGKTRGTDAEKGWLGGGVGGVLFGSGAAGALSTLLALLAISRAKSTPLERWGTLAVLVGPALVGAVAGGRWARVGQVACGFFGSLSFALLLVTSFRLASVVPRLALFLVALALTAPLVLLRRTQRYALSLCAALSGAFLLVLGIDFLLHLGLVDAVGLLVSTHGVSSTAGDAAVVVVRWESAGGKGLVAGWWLVSVVSGAWQTWWGLGIDGDDTWNAYLAQFSSDNPSSPRGTHLAPLSLFSRFRQRFSQASTLTDRQARRVAPWEDLPSDGEDLDEDDRTVASKKAARRPSTRTPTRSRHAQHESDAWDSDADTLAGLGSLGGGGTSAKPAQYGPVSASAADSEDEEGGLGVAARRGGAVREQDAGPPYSSRTPARPRALARSSTSGLSGTTAAATLRSTAASTYRSVADHDGVPLLDEWDEERLAGQRLTADPTPPRSRAQGNVASRFAARLVGRGKTTPAAYAGASVGLSALDPRPASPPHAPPPHAVPATPSLMRALARVRTAQQEARGAPLVRSPVVGGGSTGGAPLSPRLDGDHVRRASMDEWWAEVVRKSKGAT